MMRPSSRVTVAVSGPVWGAIAAHADRVRTGVAAEVDVLIRDLLGPNEIAPVTVDVVEEVATSVPVRVRLDARDCDIAPQALWDALAYARGLAETAGGTAEVGAALTEFARVAVWVHAALLCPDDPDRSAALDLGVTLASAVDGVRPLDDLLDDCVAPTVDIVVEPTYLEFLSADRGGELFPFLREGLHAELGLRFPSFRLLTDATLRPRGFRFVVNGVPTTPRIGPPMGTVLVNDTVERLALAGYAGRATCNPSNAQPGSFVDTTDRSGLTDCGNTSWNSAEYLILALAATLRAAAPGFVTRTRVEEMLGELATMYPTLGAAIRENLTTADVAAAIRALVRDGVSVRDFRHVAELLLRHRSLAEDQSWPARIAALRAGLGGAIASTLSRGSETVVVYLLGPELERSVAGEPAVAISADAARAVVSAVADEVATLPLTAWMPALLTDEAVRPALADLLRRPFPRMRVVSYNDLPGAINVQPVARISLPA
jgi:type III secretory pathway component EscV